MRFSGLQDEEMTISTDIRQSYEPMGELYLSVMIFWMLLGVLWVGNWLWFRKHHITLQMIISIPIALKIILSGLLYGYWIECWKYVSDSSSDDSTSSGGTCPRRHIAWAIAIFLLANSAAQLGVLLLIAKGWSITRAALHRSEKRAIIIWSLSFAAIQALGYGATALAHRLVTLLYILVYLVIYIAILRFIFVSIDLNMRALKSQMFLIRQASIDPSTTPAMDKYMMFKAYQRWMALYVLMGVFFTILRNFLTLRIWIFSMFSECLDILLFYGICYTFRFRTWSPYFGDVPLLTARRSNNNNVNLPHPSHISSSELTDPSLQPWRFGQPLPQAPDHFFQDRNPHRQPQVVVVIQNPASVSASGQILPNVAVGTRISLSNHPNSDPENCQSEGASDEGTRTAMPDGSGGATPGNHGDPELHAALRQLQLPPADELEMRRHADLLQAISSTDSGEDPMDPDGGLPQLRPLAPLRIVGLTDSGVPNNNNNNDGSGSNQPNGGAIRPGRRVPVPEPPPLAQR